MTEGRLALLRLDRWLLANDERSAIFTCDPGPLRRITLEAHEPLLGSPVRTTAKNAAEAINSLLDDLKE